jgi:hypothetical protein
MSVAEWFRDYVYRRKPGALVERLMKMFGKEENLTQLPGTEEDRGKLFIYSRASAAQLMAFPKNKGTVNRIDRDEDLSAALCSSDPCYIFFGGIDTNGQTDLINYCATIAPSLIKDPNASLITYHYSTTPKQRGMDGAELYDNNEGYASDEAKKVAEKLFKNLFDPKTPEKLPKPIVFITYCFGGTFQKMVLNAMSELALQAYAYKGEQEKRKAAQQFMKQFTSINFGVDPPWKSSATGKMSPYLDIQEKGVELYIKGIDDIISNNMSFSINSRADLFEASALDKKENVPPYSLFRHETGAPHKLIAVLNEGITPYALGKRPNFGGHSLPHYLNALQQDNMAPLKELIDSAMINPATLPPVGEVRTVHHSEHTQDIASSVQENVIKVWTKRIEKEAPGYREGHPLAS